MKRIKVRCPAAFVLLLVSRAAWAKELRQADPRRPVNELDRGIPENAAYQFHANISLVQEDEVSAA